MTIEITGPSFVLAPGVDAAQSRQTFVLGDIALHTWSVFESGSAISTTRIAVLDKDGTITVPGRFLTSDRVYSKIHGIEQTEYGFRMLHSGGEFLGLTSGIENYKALTEVRFDHAWNEIDERFVEERFDPPVPGAGFLDYFASGSDDWIATNVDQAFIQNYGPASDP